MSSFEKDLEEMTNEETITPLEELKIAAPIYFRNNIKNKTEFIMQLAKKMKIAEGSAYSYFSALLTGKLHDNMPPTYFKMMKNAINITKAPEYLTDLLNKAKKQPVQKRKTIREIRLQHQKKINEIPLKETDEIAAQEPDNEFTPDPRYEIVSSEIKMLPDKTEVLETRYANGTKIQMPHPIPLEGQVTGRTYSPKLGGWLYGPQF